MKTTVYLTLQELLSLHDMLIERFGGSSGIRDLGLLESDLHRPRSGYYQSLAEQGAALMQSLLMNHGFVDGNKRVAFAATAVFLRLNGYLLKVKTDEAESFILHEVIAGSAEVASMAAWLTERMTPLE